MTMTRRPLALALALLALPLGARAEDLLQSYELARNSDPQLSAAEANRLATREGAVQSRAAFLPQVSGSVGASYSDTTTELNNGLDSSNGGGSRSYGLSLSQSIFDYSNITRHRSQRALSEAADYQLESANDNLITRTSKAYFDVLVAIETLNAAEAREAALKKQFDFADKRLEVGLAPITDVHEARAQYDSARAATVVSRAVLEDAYRALEEVTGADLRSLKALPQDFQPALPSDRDAAGWVQTALDNNPALRARQLELRSAEAGVSTAKAGHLPTVDLSASYGHGMPFANGNLPTAVDNTDTSEVGVSVRIPIFAGGATQSRVRQAIAQRDASADQLEQQRRALVRNTRNAYQTLVSGITEVEARKAAVFSARSAYEASQVGLEVGTRTVLDVLTNQQNLFNAEREYAVARYNFLQNRLLLEQAAGTLDIEDLQEINRLLTADTTQKPPAP
jgi:outer membrane protein